ncbi:MAG: glycosyltransferase family 2 protein [Chitinophagaceae bacterium]|nr:glycosyltransferase family 2 protein [Chitinophagaceae bacterium]
MKVSIITPCYNHGKYLEELIRSVENTVKLVRYELIIINDGSTDEFTIVKLKELEQRGYKIIHQDNMGLSAAKIMQFCSLPGKMLFLLMLIRCLVMDSLTKVLKYWKKTWILM